MMVCMIVPTQEYSTLRERGESLRFIQSINRDSLLRFLVAACGRRFLEAARLLDIENASIAELREFLDHGFWVPQFYPAYDAVAERFIYETDWAQMDAFEPEKELVERRWIEFFQESLVPKLLDDDEFVRNVLRVVNILPVQDKQKAIDAIIVKMAGVTFPSNDPWY